MLVLTPPNLAFSATESSLLEDTLNGIDQATEVRPIEMASSLFLDERTGSVKGSSYKYTSHALSQVCKYACPGIWKILVEMAGVSLNYSDITKQDTRAAFRSFNIIVQARFLERLYDKQLVINLKDKTIDGILGPAYQYLSNSVLYEQIASLVESFGFVFHKASLYARTLRVFYIYPELRLDFLLNKRDEKYYPGLVISNSETGECAVRAQLIWLRITKAEDLICLRSPQLFRLVHSGASFSRKLRNLYKQIIREPDPSEKTLFYDRLKKLVDRRLDLNIANSSTRAESRSKFIKYLLSLGLVPELAQRILKGILSQGSTDILPKNPLEELGASLEKKSFYDLYVSLLREANRLPYKLRETVDRAAFSVLVSKNSK